MPTLQNEINSEIFNRINALEKVTSEMSGYFKGRKINDTRNETTYRPRT